jgi:P27 family predicted phage terminase small subunit
MARPPKPTALKLIEGNKGKRPIDKQEPDPDYLHDLEAPDWLPDSAKVVWNEVAPSLSKSKLLTCVDIEPLAMGCVAIAQYRAATTHVGNAPVKCKYTEDEEGNVRSVGEHINPWALIQSMTFKQAMVVFEKFGMTPQARTRIAVQPQGDLFNDNSAAKYF